MMLPDDLYARVRQVLWRALSQWESAGAEGSARPTFTRAWHWAVRLELLEPSHHLAIVRERLWRAWLEAGEPLGPTTRSAILEARPKARAMLRELDLERDPGEEG